MLIIPKGLTIEREPWKNLEVKQVNNQLILKNNGKQVIRMAPLLALYQAITVIVLVNFIFVLKKKLKLM
ncbi:hypothetical protein [Proteus mirabilis]|nr:hypothetical protein [Proteus mirabilis]